MEEHFKVIIVEHEDNVRQGLIAVFEHHHFYVESVDNAVAGLEKARDGAFDLLLIDARIADTDVFQVCADIRSLNPEQVIFMLTADSDNLGLIANQTQSADDYTSVPFAYTDLVQRAKALLRRSQLQRKTPSVGKIQLSDDIEIDGANLSGQCAEGILTFTPREIQVLEYLYKHRGKVVDSHEMLNQVWGYPRYLNTEVRAVDIHMAILTHKIESDFESPQYLKRLGEGSYQLLID